MTRKIIITLVFFFQLYILKVWLACTKMQDQFHFSALDAQLKTEFQIGNDVGYTPLLVRFFHNKLPIYGSEMLNRYFAFWSPNFGALYFSLIGYVGIFFGFYYLIKRKKNRYRLPVTIVMLLLPLINVFNIHLHFGLAILLLTIPYYFFSLYGLGEFLSVHKKYGIQIVVLLALISVWYFIIFQKDIFINFCYNI